MESEFSVILPMREVPDEPDWLARQNRVVIGLGPGSGARVDVIAENEAAALKLAAGVDRQPLASLVLVQVLRAVEHLPVQQAMTVESMGYAVLQSSPEFADWLARREEPPRLIQGEEGDPLVVERRGDVVRAELNRAEYRNALTVELRDALVELFEWVALDASVSRVELSARGACFSVGGELREFGLAADPCQAHGIRSVRNPSRLMALLADRVHCHVHSACLGSGIEIPAFAGRLSADSGSFFQLPELKLGLIPGAGGCVSISRRVGRQRTAWLALTGARINAATALEWGLIDAITPRGE